MIWWYPFFLETPIYIYTYLQPYLVHLCLGCEEVASSKGHWPNPSGTSPNALEKNEKNGWQLTERANLMYWQLLASWLCWVRKNMEKNKTVLLIHILSKCLFKTNTNIIITWGSHSVFYQLVWRDPKKNSSCNYPKELMMEALQVYRRLHPTIFNNNKLTLL